MTDQQGHSADDVWSQQPTQAAPPPLAPPGPPAPPVPPTPPGAPQYGTPQPYATDEPYGAPQPYAMQQLYPTAQAGSSDKNWLGIVSLIAPFVGLAIPGIVCGHMGLRAVKRGQANNKGLALAGTVLSWIFTGIGLLGVLLAIALPIFVTQQDSALDAEAKADLAAVNVAVAAALVDTTMMPEVTLVGRNASVDGQLVSLQSEPSAMSFVQTGDTDYCIDLTYAGGRLMSLTTEDFGTDYAPRGCMDWGFDNGDDAEATAAPETAEGAVIPPQAESEDGIATQGLVMGDCFLDPTAGVEANADGTWVVSDYVVVPCDQPHYGEVYASQLTTLAEFDLDAITAEADELCYKEFEAFVGVSYDESVLYADTYYPTAVSWLTGDREILCAISVETGDAVGSFAGSRQ